MFLLCVTSKNLFVSEIPGCHSSVCLIYILLSDVKTRKYKLFLAHHIFVTRTRNNMSIQTFLFNVENIEVYEEPVPGTKKISHHTVKLEAVRRANFFSKVCTGHEVS